MNDIFGDTIKESQWYVMPQRSRNQLWVELVLVTELQPKERCLVRKYRQHPINRDEWIDARTNRAPKKYRYERWIPITLAYIAHLKFKTEDWKDV